MWYDYGTLWKKRLDTKIMKIYLWTEDAENKSGYIFWKTLVGTLFPRVIVESKQNCSRLIKAVQNIKDKENLYIIAFDHSFDNPQIVREMLWLKEECKKHSNIYELNIISFEYLLLEFEKLILWIYAENDEFREKRKDLINIREKLVVAIQNQIDYKEIEEIKDYIVQRDQYNIEQIASKLLFDLTRNTGFEVGKKKLGICWQVSCCEFAEREIDDLCGLDTIRLNLTDKMKEILEYTSLGKELKKISLKENIC